MRQVIREIRRRIVSVRLAYYIHALGAVYVCGIVISINGWN